MHDEELDRDWPSGWPSVVTLKTTQGTFTLRVDLPKGEPENPMTYPELIVKFLIMAAARDFAEERSQEIISAVENLEQLADATELVRPLSLY